MTSTLQRTLYNSTYRPRLNLSLSQFSRPNLYCSSSIHFFQSPPRAMPTYPGSCYCRDIEYELSLASPDDARTSLCHCKSCKVRGRCNMSSLFMPTMNSANTGIESFRNKLRPNREDPQRRSPTHQRRPQGTCGRQWVWIADSSRVLFQLWQFYL